MFILRNLLVLVFFWDPILLRAAEIRTIAWDTEHAAPAANLGEEKKELLPLIRLGVSSLPEAEVMKMTFLGGSALGLSPEMASSLHLLVTKKYEEISSDKAFSKVPSALPYCFSPEKPNRGFATLHIPDQLNPDTEIILFLHGFGGSFQFYLHFLAKTFPEHLIVCPAFGINTANIDSFYLSDCIEAVSTELGTPLKKPLLIGLSAGGFGGFREYAKNHRTYRGFICLAAYPPKDALLRLSPECKVRLVAGTEEPFVIDGSLHKVEQTMKRRISDYRSELIPEQDHFFLLSAEERSRKLLQQWDAELQGN